MISENTKNKFTKTLLNIYQLQVTDVFKVFLEGETSVLFLLLSNRDTVLTPSQIAEKLGITKGRVTVMLNSLLEKELIEMNVSKEDRRKYEVSLTSKGMKEIGGYMKIADEKVNEILSEIGEDKANELIEILNLIIRGNEVK